MPLFLVATPIGNLEDMTFRAVRILSEADTILAEDTRRARQLLTHFQIHPKNLLPYHAHNEHAKTPEIIARLEAGESIALVTDAGMPLIADPGFLLVRAAYAHGIKPEIIPGVSAVTFAAAACGFPVTDFEFLGFAPVKSARRTAFVHRIAAADPCIIFYESPYRIAKTLAEMAAIFAPDREVAVIREATKVHEEVLRGPIQTLAESVKNKAWKGEITVIVKGGAEAQTEDDDEATAAHN